MQGNITLSGTHASISRSLPVSEAITAEPCKIYAAKLKTKRNRMHRGNPGDATIPSDKKKMMS